MSATHAELPPRILISNDDGIHAPGIALLESVARELSDDVWVVAPDGERSGAGHSVSLSHPIRMRELDERHYAISGTPTDCVLMAVCEILGDRRPDCVLSGINSGANLAEDLSKSGTIAAAMEGTLFGIRSIALSQLRGADFTARFGPSERYARGIIEQLLALPEWPADSFVNVNFPPIDADDVTGIRVTAQGQRPPGSFSIEARTDTRTQRYYWVDIEYTDGAKAPGDGSARDHGERDLRDADPHELHEHGLAADAHRRARALTAGRADHWRAVVPPSIGSTTPVQYDASSEPRYRQPYAISSGVPARCIGVSTSASALSSNMPITGEIIGVSV